MKEWAVPWDPIPHQYNRLEAIHVGEATKADDSRPTVLVTWTPRGRWGREQMWRISFEPPYAYRVRGVGAWPGALPLTRPKAPWVVTEGRVAFWQVVWSQFIRETVGPDSRWGVHHYVLLSQDVAYEFVADRVRVEDLGVTG